MGRMYHSLYLALKPEELSSLLKESMLERRLLSSSHSKPETKYTLNHVEIQIPSSACRWYRPQPRSSQKKLQQEEIHQEDRSQALRQICQPKPCHANQIHRQRIRLR